MDVKKSRASAHTTAKALQDALSKVGIEWPFVRGEVNLQGRPIVVMGRVHEETARKLVIFLRASLKEPRGLLCGEEAALLNESEEKPSP